MKKLFFIIILISVSVIVFSQPADIEKEHKYSIQVSPLLVLSNSHSLTGIPVDGLYSFLIGFEFQYMINEYFSFSIEPRFGMGNHSDGFYLSFEWYGYGNNGILLEEYSNEKFLLLTLNPGLLYKPSGTGMKGWYIGIYPTVGYKHLSRDEYHQRRNYPSVNQNFLILGLTAGSGYQWLLRNGFTISLGGALGRTWDIGNRNNTVFYYDVENLPIDFVVNCKIGYSF